MKTSGLTAAEEILLAAADLASAGTSTFTEWDLTVAAWKRNRNRFGLRGYEDSHPDHKRVMTEIMGKTKPDNPIRRGLVEKAAVNRYRITPLGLAEAERIQSRGAGATTVRSAQHIYDTVEPLVFHRVFLDYCRDPREPRTWLGAAAFLSLSQNTAQALDDRLRAIKGSTDQALRWMDNQGKDVLQRGPVGGARTIRRTDLEKLEEFIGVLADRFAIQIAAIRKKQ